MFWRRPAKTTWPPCARCGDPDGPIRGSKNVTPTRLSGARFGVEGQLCHPCWFWLYEKARKARRRAQTGVVRISRRERQEAA